VEQRDEVTCAAVQNRVDKSFCMVVNKTEIFLWKETDSDFKKCQRIQSDKDIFSLLVWNDIHSDPLVMFEDCSSMLLAELVSTSESKKVKRRRHTRSSQDFSLLWSAVFQHQNQPYSGSIRTHGKNKYIVKVTCHVNPEKKAVDFTLTPPAEDAMLLTCCVSEEGYHLTSYWSDGSLCVTELQAVLHSVLSTDKSRVSSVTCRRIQRLQPLHTGTVKDRASVTLSAIDTDHVCLCGGAVTDGELKDIIMVWNIKYGTLQSWQTLDKITARQSAVPRSVQTHGACCACCIPGFICVGFHHCVAVCQFLIDTCSLASALGQLDSTAIFLKDESFKPELLVTPKLARPGEALRCWSETIEKEDQVEKQVLQRLTDASKTPTIETFSSELKDYTTLKLSKQDDKLKESNAPEQGTSKPAVVPFQGKFGKKTEVLSQHFIAAVLTRCISEKKFWARESISELLRTKCVPSSSSKELLNCIVERNDLELLKECFENIKGISEDSVVLCLRHVLRQKDITSKEKDPESSQANDDVNEMPLDKTSAKYLCSILSYPVNDAFLLPCLKNLSFEDALLLIKFLMYLMERCLTGFEDDVDCNTLKYPQVLDWVGLLLNAHYTQLVITPEAHELLVSCHKTVSQQIGTYGKLRTLESFLEHFKQQKPLPKAEKVGLYTLEVLEL